MEELIKKQRKAFRKFAQWWWSEVNPKPDDVYNWHINSIKEILEAEVERKKKEVLDLTRYSNTPDSEYYYESAKTTAENDIEHLTNIISNLK